MVLPTVQASSGADFLSAGFSIIFIVVVIVLILAIVFLIKNHKKLSK